MGKSADYKEDRWYAQQRREQVGKAYVREWRGHKAAADAMIQNYGRTNDSDELVSDDSDRHRKVLAELTAWNTSNGRNADNGADYGGVDMDHGLMPPDAAPFALGLLRNCSPPQRHLLLQRLKLEAVPTLQRITAVAQRLAWARTLAAQGGPEEADFAEEGKGEGAYGLEDLALQVVVLVGEFHVAQLQGRGFDPRAVNGFGPKRSPNAQPAGAGPRVTRSLWDQPGAALGRPLGEAAGPCALVLSLAASTARRTRTASRVLSPSPRQSATEL